jgi:hypothetical protein
MVRSVAKSNALPVGASGANAAGLDAGFAREDHLHGFWEETEPLNILAPWVIGSAAYNPPVIYRSGPLRSMYGQIQTPGGSSLITVLPPEHRATKYLLLPMAASPTATLGFSPVWINPNNGEMHFLDRNLGFYTGAVSLLYLANHVWRVDK